MTNDWWRGAVIYQIYPRSFYDMSGNGVGDLAGITAKLDYVAELGVDAIWISPFFKSPMKDFGYDVADYRDVDPLFGTLEDFDRLLARAHQLGLKVIIDQVLSHTSDQHPWFEESRASRDNDRHDWYVWADPRPDGSPPNNWLSIFGGVAWQWEARRRQYYLHNFLVSQPDLNFHNPQVRQRLLDEVEFWLKRGVDGFRLDTANFYFHDAMLRDNPPKPPEEIEFGAIRGDKPYGYQRHVYDKTRPENLDFLRQLRVLLDRYPGTAMVGEISADDDLATMAEYTAGGDKLHMAYSFELLTDRFGAGHLRATAENLEARLDDGWACWSMSNHDVTRVVSRWGGANPPEGFARVLLALLCSLRGSACIYQGEELGLPEAEVPFEDLQDPYGLEFWPEYKGRDGCRTPHPWAKDGVNAGFSPARPWLPVPEAHRWLAVDVQAHLPGSTLNLCRQFLRWRRGQRALVNGAIAFIDVGAAADRVIAFTRGHNETELLAAFNLAARPVSFAAPPGLSLEPLAGHGFAGSLNRQQIELPAFGAFFAQAQHRPAAAS